MQTVYSNDKRFRMDFEVRGDAVILYQYNQCKNGGWRKWSTMMVKRELLRHLTPLALDGGDSAALHASKAIRWADASLPQSAGAWSPNNGITSRAPLDLYENMP